MAFQLSPGVNVTEIDLTTVIPAVATSDGALAGIFRWGPIGERVLVDSESQLVSRFGKPTNHNAETFFTASNFLNYANRLYISRAANTATISTPSLTFDALSTVPTMSYTGTATGYSNTDTVRVVSVTGVNAVFTVSTNNSGGALTLTMSNAGSQINSNPIITALAANGSASAGSGATFVANIVESTTSLLVTSGNSQLVTTGMYITQTTNSSAVATGLVVSDRTGNVVTFSSSFTNAAPVTLYFASSHTTFNAIGTESSASLVSNLANQIVKNETHYESKTSFDSDILYIAKYPGAIGNSLRVSVCDNSNSYQSNVALAANISYTIGSNTATFQYSGTSNAAATTAANQISVNDFILAGNSTISTQFLKVTSVAVNNSFSGNTLVTLSFEDPYRLRSVYTSNTLARYWEFHGSVESAPGQSDYVALNGNTSASDEIHLIVVDDDGLFSGTPGTILETYQGLSRASDAKNIDNSDNYYKTVINKSSKYIWWIADRSGAPSNTALNVISSSSSAPANIVLRLGADGLSEANATLDILGEAYDLFASPEDIDISLVLQGRPVGGTTSIDGKTVSNFQLANYLIDNIAELRKDCIVLISPDKNTVLNNVGNEALTLKAWRGAVHSSSYAVMDSGYKYQYDRYNDVYRWTPLNGDIAGLCVRTDNTNDAWWSPAGFNRGQIKNLVKVAFNPRKSERDVLYSNGVNPVVTFPGQGTVLFGDKTLQAKPSAFDRVNVRRLFIVLEKAIAVAAKYSLFEFNDAFTRAQFRNLVTPYLRTIKGRRGITDFVVICDDTNNTAEIIDTNRFVGDIYIKPARSINFIQLNFVAVASGVQFSEVVGKF